MELIECNPAKCFNMPSLIGRRLSVHNVVTQIWGDGLEIAMQDYEISGSQVKAALNYCSKQLCKIDYEKHQFCDGCTLRSQADNQIFNPDDYYEIIHKDGTASTISKVGRIVFLGSIEELRKEEEGINTWEIAVSLLEKLVI